MTKKEKRAQKIRDLKALLMETAIGLDSKVFISSKKMQTAHAMAETDLSTEEIIIHPDKNTIAESVHSFIHECLHLVSPNEPENTVLATAQAVYEDMTLKERQRIFRLMARKAVWEN